MRKAAFIVALVLVPVITEAAANRARYLMGTVCEVAVSGSESEIELAFTEAERIENLISTWRPASELSRVNRGEAQPSPELRALLDQADAWSRKTDRAFDPRIKQLIEVWRTREEGAIPTRDAIANALRGQAIEEGAFGKGYALDRMLAKIASPEVMIDFGGQLAMRGTHEVSIANPINRDEPVLAFTIRDASLSTSSGSEKTFEAGGRRFSHILDPRTGEALPPRGSVSVIADDALTADILSTALYVMGEDGLRWANVHRVAAIFIDPRNHVRLSAKARERVRGLAVLDPNFSLKD